MIRSSTTTSATSRSARGAVWTVAALVALGVRVVRASSARLRLSGAVWGSALLALALQAVAYGRALEDGVLGAAQTDQRLWLGQAVALTLLAGAALLGLIREQLTHRRLASVVGLAGADQSDGAGASLESIVSSRLGDPDATLAFPLDDGRLVGLDGRVIGRDGREETALSLGSAHLATVLHRHGALDGSDVVHDLVTALHLRLENERLTAEALAQAADLHASGARIVAAGDDERRALERDLHDGAQQRLVGLALGLRLFAGQHPDVPMETAGGELDATIEALRDLGRGLSPVLLRDAGLAAAVRGLSETRVLRCTALPDGRFPDVVETTAYLLVHAT